jgi:hypothetical protein
MQSRRLFIATGLAACATEPSMPADTIYELRDYTLHPGQRDGLIDLFEQEFVEPQEALGARVRATFRDLDDPDRFVWIRSFADGPSRFAALDGFYGGPVWQAHRSAANATMIDSDNVLQLRPLSGAIPAAQRRPRGATGIPGTMILAAVYYPRAEEIFASHFRREIEPYLCDRDVAPFATFATEHAPNAFPRLPIRDDTVFLTLTRFASPDAYAEQRDTIAGVERALSSLVSRPTEFRRLQPTARSALR